MSGGKLDGKVAIVTGASRGIGAAIARRLASDGAAVVLSYAREEKAAMEVVAAIRAAGGRASAVRVDLADLSQLAALFDQAAAEHGRLDILVNNAAVFSTRTLPEVDAAHYEAIFSVNVRGAPWAVDPGVRKRLNRRERQQRQERQRRERGFTISPLSSWRSWRRGGFLSSSSGCSAL
ncbi:SDR family NAD(P)-dependent oxidoreductase [Sorangium sp. So ce269]